MTISTRALTVLCCAATLLATGENGFAQEDAGQSVTVKIKDIQMDVPATWKQQPPSNRLRLSQFEIPAVKGDSEPAELVVSSFGGDGGGVAANVQRWIGQFQEQGRKQTVVQGECKQGKYVIVELSGTYNKPDGPPFLRKTKPMPGARMFGVILQVEGKGFYFLKMTGEDKTVAQAAKDLRSGLGADKEQEKAIEF